MQKSGVTKTKFMSNHFPMDKNTFTRHTVEEEAHKYANYWKGKSVQERLEAANYLILSAHGLLATGYPPIDKQAFEMKTIQ